MFPDNNKKTPCDLENPENVRTFANVSNSLSNNVMRSTSEIVMMLRDFMSRDGSKYPIGRMLLFGSVARGEQDADSDVDVCIETSSVMDFFMLDELQQKLMKLFGTKVDVLTMHNRMSSELRKSIERDAIYI